MKRIVVTRKKAIIGAIVALLVLVFAGGALVYITYNLKSQAQPVVEIVPVEDVPDALSRYTADDQVDEGIEFVNAQIKSQQDDEAKKKLLVYKSQFAARGGRVDVALDSAKQAAAIESDLSSDLALAEAYEKKGDIQKAIEYYQKVVDSIDDDSFMSRYRHIWIDKIEELSS